jgi:hypothetical protein
MGGRHPSAGYKFPLFNKFHLKPDWVIRAAAKAIETFDTLKGIADIFHGL